MRLFSRAKLILREEGPQAFFRKLLHLVFLYSSYNIYESALDPPDIKCEVDDLTIRVITSPDEIDQLESDDLVAEGFNFSRHKGIVDKGAVLFYAFAGEELAHITQVFIGRRAHEIYPYSFAMRYGHAVGLAGFTAPRYRRKGINIYTRSKALQYLREKELSRAWDVQEKDNVAAQGSVVKLGYYLWGEGYCLRLLSLFTIEWTRPKSPGVSRQIRCSLGRK